LARILDKDKAETFGLSEIFGDGASSLIGWGFCISVEALKSDWFISTFGSGVFST
jgi:hypothetical protein